MPPDGHGPRRDDRRGAARDLRGRARARACSSRRERMDPVVDLARSRVALGAALRRGGAHKLRDAGAFRATLARLPPRAGGAAPARRGAGRRRGASASLAARAGLASRGARRSPRGAARSLYAAAIGVNLRAAGATSTAAAPVRRRAGRSAAGSSARNARARRGAALAALAPVAAARRSLDRRVHGRRRRRRRSAALLRRRRPPARERPGARARCEAAHDRRAGGLERRPLGRGPGARRRGGALVRQIGVLHERVAPAGALMVARGPAVGEAAPVVTVEDLARRRARRSARPRTTGAARCSSSSRRPARCARRCCPRCARRARASGAGSTSCSRATARATSTRRSCARERLERFPYVLSAAARPRLSGRQAAVRGADRRGGRRARQGARQHARAPREPVRGEGARRRVDPGLGRTRAHGGGRK